MKKDAFFPLALALLVLSQHVFAAVESDSSQNWRPIAEITDFEKQIIAQASRQRPEWIFKNAKAFKIKHEVVIEILLRNDVVKYYAVGNSNDDFVANQDQTETQHTANLDKTTQEETALSLADEFYKIWAEKTGDELSPEELQKADSLMYAYISILKTYPGLIRSILNKSQVSTFIIGNRGKRYLEAFQKLQLQLEPRDIVDFYVSFIAAENGTKEDLPNDQERIAAIEEIKKSMQNFSGPPLSYLDTTALREIRRLDPKFYLSLPASVRRTNQL